MPLVIRNGGIISSGIGGSIGNNVRYVDDDSSGGDKNDHLLKTHKQ